MSSHTVGLMLHVRAPQAVEEVVLELNSATDEQTLSLSCREHPGEFNQSEKHYSDST